MREFVRTFVQDCAEVLHLSGPAVEIGARPAEGQEQLADLRSLVRLEPYIGCDIQPGPKVSVVCDIHHLPFRNDSVGTILCAEVLEHVHDPIRAVAEIHRVLRPNGVVIATSVMFMPVHEHPWDFWRFTPDGFGLLFSDFESSLAFGYGFDLLPEGVQAVAVKGPCPGLALDSLPRSAKLCRDWGDGRPVELGPIRFTVAELWRWTLRESAKAVKRRVRAR